MLTTYLRRVRKPLANALSWTALLLLFLAITSLMMPATLIPWLMIYLSANHLIAHQVERIYGQNLPYEQRRILLIIGDLMALVIASVSITFWYPHLFLFFNALPWALSTTFFAVSTFLMSFETGIRSTRNDPPLGPAYSLVKLFLSPRSQLAILREALNRSQWAAAPVRDWYERRMRNQYAPAERAPAENRRDPETLRLSEANLKTLVARQKTAIKALPKEAIIDDVGLYERYLADEKESGVIEREETKKNRSKANPLVGSQLAAHIQTTLQDEAKTKTEAEVKRLEAAYLSKLVPTQQAAYKAYRDFIRFYSLPYAECTIIMEDVMSKQKEFIIMEKRAEKRKPNSHETTTTCITGKTFIWHRTGGFLPLFAMAGPHAAEEPSSRENFFLPNNKKSGYEFHSYQMIDGHPLSLQLCELIENLASQLPLSAANTDRHDMIPPPAHGITHFPWLSQTDEYSYRLSPPIRTASPSNFGTFAQTSATLDA